MCRDLRSDLSRIKRAGTACIIWYVLFVATLPCSYPEMNPFLNSCLDDTEMQTLGVTWSEYVQTANELSIDVLRCAICICIQRLAAI